MRLSPRRSKCSNADCAVGSGARFTRVRAGGLDVTTVYCPNGKDVGHEGFSPNSRGSIATGAALGRGRGQQLRGCAATTSCQTRSIAGSVKKVPAIFHTPESARALQR